MKMRSLIKDRSVYCVSALIALCFFWGGSGFLVWSSQLGRFFDGDAVLLITECIGYLIQFIGIALCGLAVKYLPKVAFSRHILPIAGISFLMAIAVSFIIDSAALAVGVGIIANLACGYAQGHYLTYLTCLVPQPLRGRSFAFSYALGAVGTYLAANICGGLYSYGVLLTVTIAIALTMLLNYRALPDLRATVFSHASGGMTDMKYFRELFTQMCALVFIFNLLYKTSFYFSEIIYISGALRVEFVRAFSAIGLVIAGIVNDRDRKYGLITCLISLLFPFLCLTLSNIPNAAATLCILCFILLSFIIVYRAVCIADMAGKDAALLPFAGMGLGIGRLGESLGTFVGYALGAYQIILIGFLAVLFIAAVLLSFHIYQKVYTVTQSDRQKEEISLTNFENRYELSGREKEIFRLIVTGKSNAELADALFVSESTIKFHISHILKKTKCANRSELIKKYRSGRDYISAVLYQKS